MLEIVVVESSAEGRVNLTARISALLQPGKADLECLPSISLNSFAPEELRFHSTPDICVVGADLLSHNILQLGELKRVFPATAFVAFIDERLESMSIVEQLVRYGADDIVTPMTSAIDFARKLLFLSGKGGKESTGKVLLLDSGKGGLGVTSVAAGVAEALYDAGKKVVLVDLDVETQDLSRFLQAKPFINENLHTLCLGQQPLTQEHLAECLVPLWKSENDIRVLPPMPETDSLYQNTSNIGRIFATALEMLTGMFDCVVIDCGSIRGSLLRVAYRSANAALFLVNNDAATLYASVDRVQQLRSILQPGAPLRILANANKKSGLSEKILRTEFLRATQLSDEHWLMPAVPYCKTGQRWPGSYGTLFSQGSTKVRFALHNALISMDLLQKKNDLMQVGQGVLQRFSAWQQEQKPSTKSLPAPTDVSPTQSTTYRDIREDKQVEDEDSDLTMAGTVSAAVIN